MTNAADRTLLADVGEFLADEADLLDRGRYMQWLQLWADEALYWVPVTPDPDPDDPFAQVSLVYADRSELTERVARLESGHAYAQDPPSRTTRIRTTVRAERTAGGITVESKFIAHEVRRSDTHVWSGRTVHDLVAASDGSLLIARKLVLLVNSDGPLPNMTFLL